MTTAVLIFPNTLNDSLWEQPGTKYLLEIPSFFKDSRRNIKPNKLRLVYHRATMKLKLQQFPQSKYLSYSDLQGPTDTTKLQEILKNDQITSLIVPDPTDIRLYEELQQMGLPIKWIESPLFLRSLNDLLQYEKFLGDGSAPVENNAIVEMYTDNNKFAGKQIRHDKWYNYWRKQTGILMDNGQPQGGQYSFDKDNREPLPQGFELPDMPNPYQSAAEEAVITQAWNYIEGLFPDHIGGNKLIFPVSTSGWEKWLEQFLQERMTNFGTYEDALINLETNPQYFLFHSGVSTGLNSGLLTPQKVLDAVLQGNFPLGSTEGFVRQLMGWREYTRWVYLRFSRQIRTSNFLDNKRRLNEKWYKGTLGVAPVDDAIKYGIKSGYLHHILRLMIIPNFMNLCDIVPEDCYRWFMEFSCDAYDWVMILNTYAMAMFGDTHFTTKPYITSSNYIIKMSNKRYQKGDWGDIFDALYTNFLHNKQNKLKELGGRTSQVLWPYNRLGEEKKQARLDLAKTYLEKL